MQINSEHQMESLSANLAALNNVYGGMLECNDKKISRNGWSKRNTQAETNQSDVPWYLLPCLH